MIIWSKQSNAPLNQQKKQKTKDSISMHTCTVYIDLFYRVFVCVWLLNSIVFLSYSNANWEGYSPFSQNFLYWKMPSDSNSDWVTSYRRRNYLYTRSFPIPCAGTTGLMLMGSAKLWTPYELIHQLPYPVPYAQIVCMSIIWSLLLQWISLNSD